MMVVWMNPKTNSRLWVHQGCYPGRINNRTRMKLFMNKLKSRNPALLPIARRSARNRKLRKKLTTMTKGKGPPIPQIPINSAEHPLYRQSTPIIPTPPKECIHTGIQIIGTCLTCTCHSKAIRTYHTLPIPICLPWLIGNNTNSNPISNLNLYQNTQKIKLMPLTSPWCTSLQCTLRMVNPPIPHLQATKHIPTKIKRKNSCSKNKSSVRKRWMN